jgi:hypothetical protein
MATKKTVNENALVIDIDMNNFMIDDLEILDKCARGEASLSDEIAVFERIVVGGVRGKYKAHEIRNIRDSVLNSLRNASKDPN